MLKKVALPVAAFALLTMIAAAPLAPKHRESFLPPNNLRHRLGDKDAGGITEAQYNAVMDRIEEIYTPIVAAHGGHLVLKRLWSDDTVNSSAEQQGSDWIINAYGGLARDKAITQDGEALVLCHEMGHHLGGAPKYDGMDWASNEGEADYFANAKCLHRMFIHPLTSKYTHPTQVSAKDFDIAVKTCDLSYLHGRYRALCIRSAMAGQSVTALFTELSGDAPAHFDTPDKSVVDSTNDDHPASQCRLDTYFQGSLCNKPYTTDMSNSNPAAGGCVASQGYTRGMRPLCWYKPAKGETFAAQDEAVAAAALEKQSHAASSPTLASLKDSGVFSGL